jgi:hypothetical protein
MKKLFIGVLLAVISASASAGMVFAVPPTITTSSTTDNVNRAYAGLKWTLNEGMQPEVVVGFRHSRVESNGDTQGGDVSLSMKVFNAFQLGKLRLKYFNGQESVQGEASTGYDFTKGLFIGASVKAPYTNFGFDFLPKATNTFEPYFILDTLKKNDKPNKDRNISCPASSTYNSNTGFCELAGPPPV